MKQCINIYKSDIICITETHFSKEILDAEICIDGYALFRQDRNFSVTNENGNNVSGGGGSVIYAKDGLKATKIDWFIAPDSVAIEFETSIGYVNVVCIYRSMSLSPTQNNMLTDMIHRISSFNTESLIFGDFNLPNVSWVYGTLDAPHGTIDKNLIVQQNFLDVIHNNGFTWTVTNEITRRKIVNGRLQESTLDQICCTDNAIVNDFNIVAPLGRSDHLCIVTELNLYTNKLIDLGTIIKPKKIWSKIEPSELKQLSNDIDWSFSSDNLSSNEMWVELHGKLQNISDHVPIEKRSKNMPWSNSSLKRHRKCKENMWKTFDSNPTIKNLNVALFKQEEYEKCEIRCKVKYEKKITANLKENCKQFYGYLKSKRSLKNGICSLVRPDNYVVNSNEDIAECLANAFGSVYVQEPYGPLTESCYISKECSNHIGDIVINVESVMLELSRLDISKSMGPDNIHPKLLKSLSENLGFVSAITKLFIECTKTCKIPEQWKTAFVTSLHKKGSKKDPLNYRPVSLTCILCKIYEKLIRRHILDFIGDKISTNQHGFVESKSCLSNLLEAVEAIIGLLEDGSPVDVFYFDFCKAFDSVPHYRLLTKMSNMGITGSTLKIISDFLSGRTFQTCVGGTLSSPHLVISGVPQGSVLGPLLFVIFINDLPDHMSCLSKLFADDLKAVVNPLDKNAIDKMLKMLEEWEATWMLSFNYEKCKVLHIEHNGNPHNDVFNNIKLETTDKEKDLGILTSTTFKWDEQINACISKANQMIAWVTRNFMLRDKKCYVEYL